LCGSLRKWIFIFDSLLKNYEIFFFFFLDFLINFLIENIDLNYEKIMIFCEFFQNYNNYFGDYQSRYCNLLEKIDFFQFSFQYCTFGLF